MQPSSWSRHLVRPQVGISVSFLVTLPLCYVIIRTISYFQCLRAGLGYTMAITVPAEISAAATVIQFWNDSINPGVWITIFLVVIVTLNLCGVRLYGEV